MVIKKAVVPGMMGGKNPIITMLLIATRMTRNLTSAPDAPSYLSNWAGQSIIAKAATAPGSADATAGRNPQQGQNHALHQDAGRRQRLHLRRLLHAQDAGQSPRPGAKNQRPAFRRRRRWPHPHLPIGKSGRTHAHVQ